MRKLLLLTLGLVLALTAGAAEVFDIGNLEYEILTNTSFNAVKVRGVSSAGQTATSLTIPGNVTYNGTLYRVYEIRESAFASNTNLKTVYIKFGVNTVGSRAFQGCTALSSVTLGSSVASIGSYAFDGCTNLTSMYHVGFMPITDIYANSIPNNSGMRLYISNSTYSVPSDFSSKTGWSKFATISHERACYDFSLGSHNYAVGAPDNYDPTATRNAYLVSVDGNTTTVQPGAVFTNYDVKFIIYGIAQGACRDKTSITAIDLTNSTNLQVIEASAFSGCTNLSSITLRKGLTTIKNYAFSHTAITSLALPASVNNLGDYNFVDNCPNLTSISVASENSSFAAHDDALTSKDKKTLYRVPEGKTSYVMSELTEKINSYAFYQCKVTGISCYYGVTTISSHAFEGCTKLTQARIPSSVTTLGDYVFMGCTSLSKLLVNFSTPPTITADNMFNGVTRSNITLYTPYDKKTAYENAGWTGFKAYNPDQDQAYDMALSGYTSTGNSVGTTRYFTVVSNTSVTRNGDIFDGSVRLTHHGTSTTETSIIVPDYVTWNGKKYVVDDIGPYAFYNFTSLKTVRLPSHLRYIGYEAFWNAPLEGTLALPYGLYSINNYSFENTNLTRLIIPSSVITVSTSAFVGMNSLTELVLNGAISDFLNNNRAYNLSYLPSTCRILVPTGKVQQFKNATSWKSRAAYITAGAYDYIWSPSAYPFSNYDDAAYHITVTSNSKVTYNGVTYDGTAKYVYHPNISNVSEFITTSYETDNTTDGGRKYLITEFGDSCFYFSKITNIAIPASVTTIGHDCFYASKLSAAMTIPTTLTSIGKSAFFACSSLPSLRFDHSTPPFSEQIYANNPSTFECIVPLDRFANYYNKIKTWSRNGGAKDPYLQMAAWFTPSYDTRALGLPIAVSFTKSQIPEAYIAASYNNNRNELGMQSVSEVPANTGVLMTGLDTSDEYILHQPDGTVSAPSVNYLQATGESSVNLANVDVGYTWNTSQQLFSKSTAVLLSCYAYLKLASSEGPSGDYVYTNLFPQPGVPGDVNGDGAVTGDDLNMLINILLNKITATDPSVQGDPNIDGQGGIDGNDLNKLINILLGKE